MEAEEALRTEVRACALYGTFTLLTLHSGYRVHSSQPHSETGIIITYQQGNPLTGVSDRPGAPGAGGRWVSHLTPQHLAQGHSPRPILLALIPNSILIMTILLLLGL